MFAPKIAKPQTKAAASSTNSLAHNRSTHVLKQSIGNQATLRFLAQRASRLTANGSGEHQEPAVDRDARVTRGLSWDFSKIPVFQPNRSSESQTPPPLSAPLMPAFIQPKLLVGEVNDPLEDEADRVADQVMRMSDPDDSIAVAPLQLSRKCAACEEEEEKLQKKPTGLDSGVSKARAIVPQLMRSPGQSLGPSTRAFFEPRFRQDFSQVRVHTDARAAESAAALNALAYTVGRDVAFGRGQYRPHTDDGRRLIAHELTHTVQQGESQHYLQRWAICKPARLSLEECPPREEPGETENAKNGPMVFLKLGRSSDEAGGAVIANFNIGSATIKPNLLRSLYWKEFLRQAVTGRSRLTLVGFTDCQDEDQKNAFTRLARVEAVYRILPREVQARIFSKEAAPYTDCITSNDTKADRTLNRSVVIQLEESELDLEAEDVPSVPLVPEQIPQATTDCTDAERQRLIHAYSVGKAMIQTAMKIVSVMKSGTEEERLLKKYFGKDAFEHRFHIQKGFSDTLREWSRMGPIYDYHCRKKNVGDCEPGPEGQPTLGYVSAWTVYGKLPVPHGDINICGSAFEQNDEDLAITVVHESSHRLDWTVDREYCSRALGCTLSTETAEDNADSYAQFAGEAFSRWY